MSVYASTFGTCTVTIDNQTPVELTYNKSKSKIDGVLSSDSPTSVPAKATRVYKVIPTIGKTTSAAKFVFTINGATALTVDAKAQPPIIGLDAESDLASVAVGADANDSPEDSLVGTVSVRQATEEAAAKETILAEAAEKAA